MRDALRSRDMNRGFALRGDNDMEQFLTFIRNSIEWIRWQDILDILILAFIFYQAVKLLKDSSAGQLLKGIVAILIIYAICGWLQLNVIYYILTSTLQIGIIALIILFQPELRRMLDTLGRRSKLSEVFSTERTQPNNEALRTISQLVETCSYMSRTKTGALIVLERETKLGEIMKTGTIVNADITSELLKNIFFNKAPLHDGAVVIRDNRIAAAGCFLPLSANKNISSELGTRHRAGVGISETCDALVLIVSEETGSISVAEGGLLKRNLSTTTLTTILHNGLIHDDEKEDKLSRFKFWKRKKENQ